MLYEALYAKVLRSPHKTAKLLLLTICAYLFAVALLYSICTITLTGVWEWETFITLCALFALLAIIAPFHYAHMDIRGVEAVYRKWQATRSGGIFRYLAVRAAFAIICLAIFYFALRPTVQINLIWFVIALFLFFMIVFCAAFYINTKTEPLFDRLLEQALKEAQASRQ